MRVSREEARSGALRGNKGRGEGRGSEREQGWGRALKGRAERAGP